MIERKSGRSRKSVDYSKFAADEDSDDDFKESTPPVAKRQKVSNKENSAVQDEKPLQTKKEPRPKKSRQTLDEKLYERELQKALELSLSQSDGSQETPITTETSVSTETTKSDLPILIEEESKDSGPPSPVVPQIDPPVLMKVDETEEIEVLQTGIKVEESDGKSSSRRKASTKKRYVESDSDGEEPDSDFEVDKEADSDVSEDDSDDDDFNADDSDSDFGVSKKTKGKKASSTPKPKAGKSVKNEKSKIQPAKSTAKPSVKSTPKPSLTKTVTTTPGLKKSSSALNKSPAISKPVNTGTVNKTPSSGLTARKTNWNPPASSSAGKSPLGGASVKSPSTGLRIGLSRNMKLKPLHPNLKMN